VKRLIPQSRKIVLDLTDLTQMDSMGLGTIVGLYVSAKASGSTLILINLSQRVRELFRITNVWSILEVYGENIIRMP
jgi:anti-anti-sigma factor